MWSFVVVVVVPGFEAGVALVGVGPVFGIGPLVQRGLDEAFCLAIGLRRVGSGAAVPDVELLAGEPEAVGAVTAAVVGEQGAHADAVGGEEGACLVEEGDGGFGLLVDEQLGKSHARVIVDGDMQGQRARMHALAAQPAIAAQHDLAEAGHSLDVQMHQVARYRVAPCSTTSLANAARL